MGAEKPVGHLDVMGAELGHESAGIGAVKTPIQAALKAGVGDGVAPVAVTVPVCADLSDLPDRAVADKLKGAQDEGVEQALVTDDKDLLAAAVGVGDGLALVDGVSEALLAVDMLAGGKCIEAHARVEIKRRGDEDAVEAGHIEHLAVIGKAFCAFDARQTYLKVRVVVVAQGNDFNSWGAQEMGGEEAPARAVADEADAHAVRRRVSDGGGAQGRPPGQIGEKRGRTG